MPAAVRTFFALVPDGAARAALSALAKDLARQSEGRVAAPDSIHLTLAWVGDVGEDRLPTLDAIGAALPGAGFDLVLDVLGSFARPRTAWVAPTLIPAPLEFLQQKLRTMLADEGFRVEDRTFAPHLTLARKCAQLPPRASIPPIPWRPTGVSLVASSLDSRGAHYRELGAWPLGSDVAIA
jgi:2'-5' RNA ligase